MLSFLPKTKITKEIENPELLPTHEPFYKKYALVIIVFILVFAVSVLAFGGILYRTGKQLAQGFVTNNQGTKQTNVQTKPVNTSSDLKIETGYVIKKNNEWEFVTIINEPNQVELIASSQFNATRIEITSYSKEFPDWENNVGLIYFDVSDKDEKTINNKEVTVITGRDSSLYAKAGMWEDDEKILEIRVFSASKQNTNQVFDQLAKSVKSLDQDNFRDSNEIDESSESLEIQ